MVTLAQPSSTSPGTQSSNCNTKYNYANDANSCYKEPYFAGRADGCAFVLPWRPKWRTRYHRSGEYPKHVLKFVMVYQDQELVNWDLHSPRCIRRSYRNVISLNLATSWWYLESVGLGVQTVRPTQPGGRASCTGVTPWANPWEATVIISLRKDLQEDWSNVWIMYRSWIRGWSLCYRTLVKWCSKNQYDVSCLHHG